MIADIDACFEPLTKVECKSMDEIRACIVDGHSGHTNVILASLLSIESYDPAPLPSIG
jgi:hypothetical protein